MIQLFASLIGFGFGWFRATRRGGTTGDKVQYGIAHGILFGLVTMAAAAFLYQTGIFRPDLEG